MSSFDTPRASTAAPVKVVHVVLGLNVGGLERLVLDLLAHTDRARFAPVVCALDEPGVLAPELERLGVPLHLAKRAPGLDARLPVRLARWLDGQGAAIVHTHNATPHLYGALAARLARASARGVGPLAAPSWMERARRAGRRPRVVHTKHGRNAPDMPRKVLVNRLASALSDRVVAVSDDAARVAVDIERVDARKVVTIHNGIDVGAFRPGADARAAREKLGVPREGFHVGCVARLAEVKDHATLLEAFARLRAEEPGAHLTLVGDGPERARLEALAERLGLSGAVTFAGARGDVAAVLPAFDVFALSSRSEGVSLTLLEAAASGLAVVATRVGGNREIVIDGETGVLVAAGDPASFARALASMARSDRRRAMGEAGRALVERRFSIGRMAREYQDLYAEVLQAP